jgi:methionyl-tRNA formyltransferase
MKKNNNIVFFGTPQFALPALNALHQEGFNIVLVVTKPDKPAGRDLKLTPTPIKKLAQKLNYQICESINNLEIEIKKLMPDLGVVVAYGKIIPQKILDSFPLGFINIHPSLLPKYRGTSPIQTAILNGDQETGITIIKLDKKMDHGDIISKIQTPISKTDNSETLHNRLANLGAELLIKTLPDYLLNKIKPTPQDHSQATFTKIITKEDGQIDWSKKAEVIERQIRAYYPWPGSYTSSATESPALGSRKIKIISARLAEGLVSAEAEFSANQIGKFQQKNGQLSVQCGQGTLIIEKLQIEGKKPMTGKEFINGYLTY